MQSVRRNVGRTILVTTLVLLLIVVVAPVFFRTGADPLPNRQVVLSEATAGTVVNYKFSFDLTTSALLGSIDFQFCENSPVIGDSCTASTGLDASTASLLSQSGETGFSIATGTPNNEVLLTRTAVASSPGPVVYELSGMVNPSVSGSYYVRVQVFSSEDGTGAPTEYGGLAYAVAPTIAISTTVPPYLLFCMGITIAGVDCDTASGDYINFGELSSNSARTGSTQMVIATNAEDGYAAQVIGTTMLSGTNTIPALLVNDVSRPGTSQFGINLRDNSDPNVGANPSGPGSGAVAASYNVPNRYHFVSGEQVVSSPTVDEYRKYTVSYIVNIAKGQTPGIYVSTLTYVCLATF